MQLIRLWREYAAAPGVEQGIVFAVSDSEVRRAYSLIADRYIERFGSVADVPADDLHMIERHLGSVRGQVLDLGCGPGHLTGFLHSRSVDVTGIDLVPEFVAHARRVQPECRFELGSMSVLDRPDGSVAGVLAYYSLIHLDPGSLDGVLSEIRRVMVPGGVLVVGFFDWPHREPFAHRAFTAYRWPLDELAARLSRARYTEVERRNRAVEGERPQSMLVARAS